MGFLGTFLTILAQRLPVMLALLAGLIFAIVRREKHPRISLLAGIYFGGSLLLSILGTLVSLWPVFARMFSGFSMTNIGVISSVAGFVIVLFNAGLTVLLIFAIFGERADLDE